MERTKWGGRKAEKMKVIFLDIDGVLNDKYCRARAPSGCKGAVDAKLKLLREIVRQTDARLVLISSWKKYWKREETTDRDDPKRLCSKAAQCRDITAHISLLSCYFCCQPVLQ